MFIRGRERIADVWPRFQVPLEGFVVAEHRGIFEVRIVANADRALDLFLELSRHLSPAVQVSVEDVRAARRWSGRGIPLADATTAVHRVRSTLSAHAGVECALFDSAEQVTLSPYLEIFVYALTERWYYFLRDLGVRRFRSIAPRSWRPARDDFPPVPLVEAAVNELVTRLALVATP